MKTIFVARLFVSFLLRFLFGMISLTALAGFISGIIGGLTGTDLRLFQVGDVYYVILALPVTFWAFYSSLNGKYVRFDIIVSETANSGDRRDE